MIYDSVKKGEGKKVSILADIDFGIELMHTDKINVSYIINLIRDIDLSDKEKRDKDVKHILRELDRADNEELRLKVELLKNFLDKVVPTLLPEDSIDEAYSKYNEEKREEEVEEFASEVGVEKENIKSYLSEYEYSGLVNQKEISDDIVAPFLKKRNLVKKIKSFIFEHIEKFSL